jgi:hypothetical protein
MDGHAVVRVVNGKHARNVEATVVILVSWVVVEDGNDALTYDPDP